METLNNSLKNTIQFILCIQEACDKHRKCMELLWQQEYSSYVTEWKPSQTESKLLDVKNCGISKSHNASKKCIQKNSDDKNDDLDLILADSLLEKAKNIRSKNKKLITEHVDSRKVSTFSIDKIVASSVCYDPKHALQKVKPIKTLLNNKSDLVINSQKSYVAPRSKSASKPPETAHRSKSSAALLSKTSVVNQTNNTFKNCDVMLDKNLDKLKNLQLNVPSCQKTKGRKVALPLDFAGKIYQHQIPSHPCFTEFLSLMKGKLNDISPEVKVKLWYPFLSSKSGAFLTAFNCDSLSSIKKMYSILYSIQEIMMWLDLLYLLEVEICPNLIVDITDVNSLRICSYLRSIFHPNSQRIPFVFPHSAVK